MTVDKENIFAYENYVIAIQPCDTEEQDIVLNSWNALYQAYFSDWQTYQLNPTLSTAKKAKESILKFTAGESKYNDTLSSIYRTTPDPEEASGNWDAGKEKASREARKSAIEGVKIYTEEKYIEAKKNEKDVSEFIEKNEGEPKKGLKSMDTFLTLNNGTPYDVTLSARIKSESNWPSDEYRPDKNILDEKGGPLKLIEFQGSEKLQENVNASETTAQFIVDVCVSYTMAETNKFVETKFSFTCDQMNTVNRPEVTKDTDSVYFSPNSRILPVLETDKYKVLQQFPEEKSDLSQIITILEAH